MEKKLKAEPFLETERLIIYPSSYAFEEEFIKLYTDEEVMRYIIGRKGTADEARQRLNVCIKQWEKHGFALGFVLEKETGAFVGRSGIVHIAYDDTQPEIEVGYILLKPFWGKGYATELAKALIKWGFENLETDSLFGIVMEGNEPSSRVLKKAGMVFDKKAPYPSHKKPSLYYRIRRSDIAV